MLVGYHWTAFLDNVVEFHEPYSLPREVKFGEQETAQTFVDKNVSWHKMSPEI